MAQQVVTLAKEETSQAILNILNNSEYGQEALEDILTNSTYGLNAIKGLVSDSKSLLQNSTYGLSALKTLINGVSTTAGKKLKFKGRRYAPVSLDDNLVYHNHVLNATDGGLFYISPVTIKQDAYKYMAISIDNQDYVSIDELFIYFKDSFAFRGAPIPFSSSIEVKIGGYSSRSMAIYYFLWLYE